MRELKNVEVVAKLVSVCRCARERERERERERQTHRHTDTQTHRENSNSKTLILKDSSVRSIWTYLTASPCYSTNISKHDYTTNR